MQKKLFIALLSLCVLLSNTFAQDEEEPDYFTSPFQLTFLFPPLSTNGFHNSRTVNKISLNLLLGRAGGVDGLELGGFINSDKYFVKGLQVAGFGNMVDGNVSGAQLAGFCNLDGSATNSLQGAGFMNINGGYSKGLQAAGFGNISGGSVTGAQVAGFFNASGDTIRGAQVGGFFNSSDEIHGAQVGGFTNVAGYVKGLQLSGFLNVCDSIDGVPVGFISYVRHNGYRKFEFSISEVSYANFSYKMGVRRLYNIYTIGKLPKDGTRWIVGAGFGYERDLGDQMLLNIEAVAHQELWIADSRTGRFLAFDRLNMLNQVKTNFGMILSDKVTMFFGPTLNVSVAESNPDIGLIGYYEIGPKWAILNTTSSNVGQTHVKIWVGINGGIRF